MLLNFIYKILITGYNATFGSTKYGYYMTQNFGGRNFDGMLPKTFWLGKLGCFAQ